MEISKSVVTLYSALDYLPIAASITNFHNIIQKNYASTEKLKSKSHYYTHLRAKSTFRCAVLMIPGLGQIFILIYDISKYRAKAALLAALDHDPTAYAKTSSRPLDYFFHTDREIILKAVQNDLSHDSLLHAREFYDDFEVMTAGITNNPHCFHLASKTLKNNPKFVCHAIIKCHLIILDEAGPDVLKDEKTGLLVVKKFKEQKKMHRQDLTAISILLRRCTHKSVAIAFVRALINHKLLNAQEIKLALKLCMQSFSENLKKDPHFMNLCREIDPTLPQPAGV